MSLMLACILTPCAQAFRSDQLCMAGIFPILFVLPIVGASVAPTMWLCIPARARFGYFFTANFEISNFQI